jgi:hypothetical protein
MEALVRLRRPIFQGGQREADIRKLGATAERTF